MIQVQDHTYFPEQALRQASQLWRYRNKVQPYLQPAFPDAPWHEPKLDEERPEETASFADAPWHAPWHAGTARKEEEDMPCSSTRLDRAADKSPESG